MESTSRRYASPVRPPRLVAAAGPSPLPPVLCLHCGDTTGHARPSLVGFAWGRVMGRR